MILLYTMTLTLLAMIRLAIAGRARILEKRYSTVASAVLKLANPRAPRAGNGSGQADVFAEAKRTYELGRQVQKRDALEGSYYRWRGLADRFAKWVNDLREWKGRKLPYSFGVLDVWLALYLVDHFGVGRYLSVQQMVDLVVANLR